MKYSELVSSSSQFSSTVRSFSFPLLCHQNFRLFLYELWVLRTSWTYFLSLGKLGSVLLEKISAQTCRKVNERQQLKRLPTYQRCRGALTSNCRSSYLYTKTYTRSRQKFRGGDIRNFLKHTMECRKSSLQERLWNLTKIRYGLWHDTMWLFPAYVSSGCDRTVYVNCSVLTNSQRKHFPSSR